MTKDRADHYGVFARRPPKGSVYEFHSAAFALLDADQPLQWSTRPTPIVDIMPREQRIWALRHNRFLREREDSRQRLIEEMLTAAGIDRAAFDNPSEALKQLLHELTIGSAAIDKLMDLNSGSEVAPIPVRYRVLAAARYNAPGGDRLTAEFLNHGSVEKGLTEDHIYRGVRGYINRVRKLPRSAVPLEMYLTAVRFRVCEYIRAEAGRDPFLRRFKGAELVQRINLQSDFCFVVGEATDDLGKLGGLPPLPSIEGVEREISDAIASLVASAPGQ